MLNECILNYILQQIIIKIKNIVLQNENKLYNL